MKYLTLAVACFAVACSQTQEQPAVLQQADVGAPSDAGTIDPGACAAPGETYLGLSGRNLVATRKETIDAPLAASRMRLKPVQALRGEFRRVFGEVPALLANADALLGVPTARWHREPVASSFALHSLFRASFDACDKYVDAHAAWLQSNTASARTAACDEMLSQMWLRKPGNEQLQSCEQTASGALLPAGPEGRDASAKQRWKFACAVAATAPEFLTYGATR